MPIQGNSGNLAVDDTLAVGTHVFSVNPNKGAVFAIVDDLGAGGTANIAFTMDPRDISVIATGTPPAQTFAATVAHADWFLGAVAQGAAGLSGRVTAVEITIATQPVKVQIGYRTRALGSHGA